MEYIWYIIAAPGTGIGTGLAGLSAATVMVPILIVLCPGFSGEAGAYQATAIALASDILGSAVTAITYAKHKNMDLKRGWIMLACILLMSTAGSYAAWLAGNVVLGSFSLFLTFFIGIRFLIKPDTSRENTNGAGEKLGWKGVIISLYIRDGHCYLDTALLLEIYYLCDSLHSGPFANQVLHRRSTICIQKILAHGSVQLCHI